MTIGNAYYGKKNLGFKTVSRGEGGEEAKVACQKLDGAAPYALYLLGTEISSVHEAWLVRGRKEQALYWVLNELFTDIHLSIT